MRLRLFCTVIVSLAACTAGEPASSVQQRSTSSPVEPRDCAGMFLADALSACEQAGDGSCDESTMVAPEAAHAGLGACLGASPTITLAGCAALAGNCPPVMSAEQCAPLEAQVLEACAAAVAVD